jgi:hypothetical protein
MSFHFLFMLFYFSTQFFVFFWSLLHIYELYIMFRIQSRICKKLCWSVTLIKGTVSRDLQPSVVFIQTFILGPWLRGWNLFEYKFQCFKMHAALTPDAQCMRCHWHCMQWACILHSVVDPDPEPQGSETFCWIRICNSRFCIWIRLRIRN